MKLRKENERGTLDIDWLKARYSFSFGSFFDPDFMGFKSLKVINNDIISKGGGFNTHSHRNMEILTFVLSGEIEHRDNIGNHSIIKPGEIQLMSAGSGISHSEINPSGENETELFQIWIEPNTFGKEPRYKQFNYKDRVVLNKLIVLASNKPFDDKALLYQDTIVSIGSYEVGSIESRLNSTSSYWVQMIKGEVKIGENHLCGRDGAGFEIGELSSIETIKESELLLFEFL